MKIVPVVLCGGNGTRLWPMSRELFPKQFLSLMHNEQSMLQETILRLGTFAENETLILCNEQHRFLVAEQLRQIEKSAKIMLEPSAKNTAPALALAAFQTIQDFEDAILLVFPSDHILDNNPEFQARLQEGINLASEGYFITFGIKPTSPHTGYGYIKTGSLVNESQGFKVEQFVEKPDLTAAQRYLESGNFFWNSGMFIFRASIYLEALKNYANDIYQICLQSFNLATQDQDFIRVDKEIFESCRADSIDYAIMEKTDKAVVIPLDNAWSDVGAWSSLWEIQPRDESGNVIKGDVITKNVSNSLLHSQNRLVVGIGLKDVVVVETTDAILVADKNQAADIKEIVNALKKNGREEIEAHRVVYRPWGSYETLIEGTHFKVKHITVKPKASLSLQLHHHRSEHWVVVSGTAQVTCDENVFDLQQNQSTYIPAFTKHRLYNPGEELLEIVEVQSGTYLGEDDIVRFEDQYGRIDVATQTEETQSEEIL